ncbi:MAG: hypothetical protein KKD44_14080 [Proteobacteria bacterium]|nr:hypothetical protein [Pseudomonadota bacterium]
MEKNTLKEKLLKILSGYMDIDQVTGNEDESILLDSMMFLEIIAVIESELDVTIFDEEIESMDSFNAMLDIISSKVA